MSGSWFIADRSLPQILQISRFILHGGPSRLFTLTTVEGSPNCRIQVKLILCQLMSKIIFVYTLRRFPFSIAIHYPSPYKSCSGIFKQVPQLELSSVSDRCHVYKKSHVLFIRKVIKVLV